MRGTRHLATALATTAAVVCGICWFLSSQTAGTEHDFDSCDRSGGVLTLTYSHGPGQGVTIARQPQGDGDVTVSYRLTDTDGPHVASSVTNVVEFDDLSGRVFYPDGREVKCVRR